jgi:hypothetical protein
MTIVAIEKGKSGHAYSIHQYTERYRKENKEREKQANK